jgi:hypothetical protein
MENAATLQSQISPRKFILRVMASGLAMGALDLVLNAGLFAKVWLEPSSFLLSPEQLFRRLPLGYIAFLVQAAAYVWLTMLVGVRNWKEGGLFGLKLGVILNIAAVLGLRSGTTATWTLLLGPWFIGGTVLTTAACFMAGLAAQWGEKRALLNALFLFIGAVVIIVILQSTGLAPATHAR